MKEKFQMRGKRPLADDDDFISHRSDRIGVFIDGANNYASTRALGFDMDYAKLLKYIRARGRLVRAYYYTTLPEVPISDWLATKVVWLDYNGYTLVTKPAKEYIDALGHRRFKSNMDVEMSVHMLEQAPYLDHIMLFSGDSDLCPLVEAVQRGYGARVTVVSTAQIDPPAVSVELRRRADAFLELKTLAPHVTRTWFAEREDLEGANENDETTPPVEDEV
jgi:uncharacterized LabA/DUF88 family protein